MRLRRRRAERHPARCRRLANPVISVGNLSVGGTGKSPVVAALARWLVAQGERPSILSRGYGRADPADGVVVVSDGRDVLATLDRAGDEPLMLARHVPGAAVCVSPDRHLAGVLAERVLGCTVHVLDDGFQHLDLRRDLDVLVTTVGEISGGRVIPSGRLREPIDAASRAHVLVVSGATAGAAASEAWSLGISQSCGAVGVLEEPVRIGGPDPRWEATARDGRSPAHEGSVIALAGIANPERFTESLRAAGWQVADTIVFPDHHRYTHADMERTAAAIARAGASAVFTTDKDAVRVEALGPLSFRIYRVPLTVHFDPADALFGSVAALLDVSADGRRRGARA